MKIPSPIDLQILAGIGLIGVMKSDITFKVSNMYSIIMYAENWIQNWGREEVVALAILKSYLNKTWSKVYTVRLH